MVRTVPREFDWSACPPGHQAFDADHEVTIEVKGKGVKCTCLADAKALADHPENNRTSGGVL
jgi:hypothetical protein